jgi:DsbC/DsbD-like thiol-disulfide interchange protein
MIAPLKRALDMHAAAIRLPGLSAAALSLLVTLAPTAPRPALAGEAEPAVATPWITEQTARARIVAGGAPASDGKPRLVAGLELTLEDGWKTYWRNPGSSGVPPRVEDTGSENLKSLEVLFPAPLRFPDRDGDTIGYKSSVTLPILVEPVDPQKPVVLRLSAEVGICREVCIPVQPAFELSIPPDAAAKSAGSGLQQAMARVPTTSDSRSTAPRIAKLAIDLSGPRPAISIEATFAGDAGKSDVFLEAPDGIWIPMTRPQEVAAPGTRRFVVDLTDGADIADLKGKTIRATLVGETAQSETTFVFAETR